MKNRNWKPLLLIAGATLLAGAFSTFLSGDSMESYRLLRKPLLAPRAIVFPIVWTLLYLLMSISAWLIYETRQRGKHNALKFYVGQLAVNLLWPLLFFGMKLYLFSFFWLLFLLLLVNHSLALASPCLYSATVSIPLTVLTCAILASSKIR